ncbi:MAG: hypothetical protein ACOCQD_04735 [archaeon]
MSDENIMTDEEFHCARHALGLGISNVSYRNYFSAGEYDIPIWESMCQKGFAFENTNLDKSINPDPTYHLTQEGIDKTLSIFHEKIANDSGWKQENKTVYQLNKNGENRFYLTVQPGFDDDGNRISDEELEEIARLISASKDMYECLKWYVKYEETNNEPDNEFFLQGYYRARRVLKKARGYDDPEDSL